MGDDVGESLYFFIGLGEGRGALGDAILKGVVGFGEVGLGGANGAEGLPGAPGDGEGKQGEQHEAERVGGDEELAAAVDGGDLVGEDGALLVAEVR